MRERRVLIVAPDGDLHALVVRERLLALGADTVVWSTSTHPWKCAIEWTPDGVDGGPIVAGHRLSSFDAVWWRRYAAPTVSPLVSDDVVRRFCRAEAAEAMRGVFLTHPCVLNDITAEQRASSKMHQLATASRLALTLPRTLVSNDPDRIRAFAADTGSCICKTLYGDYPHGVPTRPLTAADLADTQALSMAPLIVQERITCVKDVRVEVIGAATYAGELVRDDPEAEVDWRKDPYGWRPHSLPAALARALVGLVGRLGLQTGAIDLRLDRDGRYVFFEVNPSGQFLFLEIDAGLPVSAAMARHVLARAEAAATMHPSA